MNFETIDRQQDGLDIFLDSGEDAAVQADDLDSRVFSIKPPGKGDSGMAEEKG